MWCTFQTLSYGAGECILCEACLFDLTFYKDSHSKRLKQRALHVHQRKTKHIIAKLFAQPFPGSTKLFEKYGGMYKVEFGHQGLFTKPTRATST